MLRVISGQKEEFFVRLIYKLIEGGEVMGDITVITFPSIGHYGLLTCTNVYCLLSDSHV